MIQFYACHAETVTVGGRPVYRPNVAHAVDSNGGCWKLCEQDHNGDDGTPTHFLTIINDRLDPTGTSNPAVWTAVNAVSNTVLLGSTFLAAVAEARILFGSLRASRMNNQVIGGESVGPIG